MRLDHFCSFCDVFFYEKEETRVYVGPNQMRNSVEFRLGTFQGWSDVSELGDCVRTSHLFVLVNSFDLRLPLALGCVRPLKLPCTTQKYLNILFFELCTQLNPSSPSQFLLEKFRWQNSPNGECYHLSGNISFP